MIRSNRTRSATHHLLLAALAVLAWTSHAQGDPPTPATGNAAPSVAATTGDPGAVAAQDAADPGATATTATAAAEPAAPSERYPRAVIARPLTLPAGLAMAGADFTGNNDLSVMGSAPILGYGITDDLEIQVPYAFATKEFEAKGILNVDVGYKLLRGALDGKLEAIARVRGGYDLLAEAATPLMLGVHVQYNVTDKLAIITGFPGTQQLSIAVSDGGVMDGPKPIVFNLPVSVGYQATPIVYLQLDTRLAQLDIKDSSNAFLFSDTTPAALTVVCNALPALDVQASIGTDLSNSPGDRLAFLIGARYYAGKL